MMVADCQGFFQVVKRGREYGLPEKLERGLFGKKADSLLINRELGPSL